MSGRTSVRLSDPPCERSRPEVFATISKTVSLPEPETDWRYATAMVLVAGLEVIVTEVNASETSSLRLPSRVSLAEHAVSSASANVARLTLMVSSLRRRVRHSGPDRAR